MYVVCQKVVPNSGKSNIKRSSAKQKRINKLIKYVEKLDKDLNTLHILVKTFQNQIEENVTKDFNK